LVSDASTAMSLHSQGNKIKLIQVTTAGHFLFLYIRLLQSKIRCFSLSSGQAKRKNNRKKKEKENNSLFITHGT
jgi:hypothetical protein